MISRVGKFEWDEGNSGKNLVKHRVTDQECEEVFFDPNKLVRPDTLHANGENRHILLGRTRNDRVFFVVFTIRNSSIRVISARDLNQKERHFYYGKQK